MFGNRINGFLGNSGLSASSLGFVPYIGATKDVNLGVNNISANAYFNGFTSIVASASLVTLTVYSTPVYVVTGSGGQTIQLPIATTLPNGTIFSFNNNQSSGAISVNNNSATLVKSVPSGAYLTLVLLDNTTATGTWDAHFQVPANAAWSTNTLDWAGSITNTTWNGNVVQPNRGGTGQSTYTNGQLLIGNTTGNTLSKSTLTQGAGITITNGAGSITIASSLTQTDSGWLTLTTTPTFTATVSPSGATTNNYRWTRNGNLITLDYHLKYANGGSNVTFISIPFPSGLPAPSIPSGYSTAGNVSIGRANTGNTESQVNGYNCFCVMLGDGTVNIIQSGNASAFTQANIQYFTT